MICPVGAARGRDGRHHADSIPSGSAGTWACRCPWSCPPAPISAAHRLQHLQEMLPWETAVTLEGSLEAASSSQLGRIPRLHRAREVWELPGGVNEQCPGWDTSGKQEGIPDLDTEQEKGESRETERSVCPVKESVMVSYHPCKKRFTQSHQLWATESEAPRRTLSLGRDTLVPLDSMRPGLALNKGLIRSCSLQRRL